jgi:hypothetical protein
MTISLLLITSLHTMIFTFFQIPDNFLNEELIGKLFYLKVLVYVSALIITCLNQKIMQAISLKHTMICGLLCNLLALGLIWISLSMGGNLVLIVFSLFFIGLALPSVFNCLITYFVLEYPKKTGVGFVALFAFANGGVLLSSILFAAFRANHFSEGFFLLTMGLLVIAAFFVAYRFFDPRTPKHFEHFRRGTLLWKEMHYRLALFVLAAMAYAMAESTFSLWGEVYMRQFISAIASSETISVFWLSLIVGQLLLLAPLYFIPAKRIFPILILFVAFALFFFRQQMHTSGFLTSLILGGLGCSAIFPILLSFMEKELMLVSGRSHQESFLPFIETGTSLMIGGYILGIGCMDLWVQKADQISPLPIDQTFHSAILLIAATGLIITYLNWSAE